MKKRLKLICILMGIILLGVLLYFGNEIKANNRDDKDFLEAKGKVMWIENDEIIDAGISRIGIQRLGVKILSTQYKGVEINAVNELLGKLDFDNIYEVNDKVILAIRVDGNKIVAAKVVDLYRLDWEIILFLVFIILLIGYARFVGLKAIISFVLSVIIIWHVYIPMLMSKKDPVQITILLVGTLSAIILFSIAGFTRKGLIAFIGTVSGLIIGLIVTYIFGYKLRLYGYTAPFAETLLFSGHLDLDIRGIFYSAIILGASGAAMDIAIDVSASMEEIKVKRPDMKRKELMKSGFNIGRAVIGTMTTTLLLAYAGGYLTLLMLFATKSTSIYRLLNLKIMAAEIMRTLVGSIGLVIVAPVTAIVGSILYTSKKYEDNLEGLKHEKNTDITQDIYKVM